MCSISVEKAIAGRLSSLCDHTESLIVAPALHHHTRSLIAVKKSEQKRPKSSLLAQSLAKAGMDTDTDTEAHTGAHAAADSFESGPLSLSAALELVRLVASIRDECNAW